MKFNNFHRQKMKNAYETSFVRSSCDNYFSIFKMKKIRSVFFIAALFSAIFCIISFAESYTYDIQAGERIDVVVSGEGIYVRFEPVIGGEYWFESHSPISTNCILLDENKELIYDGEEFQNSGDGENFKFKFTLQKGKTYYYFVHLAEGMETRTFPLQVSMTMKTPEAGHIHNFSTTKIIQEPTCEIAGQGVRICICSISQFYEIPATGHRFEGVVIEPTCTQVGRLEGVCLNCGKEIYEEYKPLGHDYKSEFVMDKEPTCTENGSESFHCTRCDAIQSVSIRAIPKTGHKFGEWIVSKSATCTTEGREIRKCRICEIQETNVTPALGHSFNENYTLDKAVSCTSAGSMSHHCIRCGEKTDITTIFPQGHEWGEFVITKAASCLISGSKTRKCMVCGENETDIIPPLNHAFEAFYTVDKVETCTQPGLKSLHCVRCNATTNETVIPATGHSWGKFVTTKAATCTSSGSSQRQCKNCSSKETKLIAALGHSFSKSYTVDKAATCTQPGSKSQHCTRCSVSQNSTVIKASGHKWGKYSIQKSVSCTSNGSKARKCSLCGKQESAIIAKKGHSFSKSFSVDKKATTGSNGSMSRHCSKCSAVTEKVSIPKINTFTLSKTVYIFNGNAKKPSVTIKDGKGNTISSSNYTVKYEKSPSAIGKHTVTVVFKGKYSGSKAISYKIVPNDVSNVNASTSNNKIKLSFSAVKGAEGYQIYVFNPATNSFEPLAKSNKTNVSVALRAGTAYKLAVKAYKSQKGKIYYSSNFVTVLCATKPSAPKLQISQNAGSAVLKWNSVPSSGYEIYMSVNRDGNYKLVKKINSSSVSSFEKPKLKTGQLYFFKIRAYCKNGDYVVYSNFSPTVVVRIK